MSAIVWLLLLTNISCWMTHAQTNNCEPKCEADPKTPTAVNCAVGSGVVELPKSEYNKMKYHGQCLQLINAGPGNRILLTFTVFHIEHKECNDNLTVYDSKSLGNSFWKLCAKYGTKTADHRGWNGLPDSLRSSGSYFLLQFNTDDTVVTGDGYRATYSPFPMTPTLRPDKTVYYVGDTIVLTCTTTSTTADMYIFKRGVAEVERHASAAYTITQAAIGTHDKTYTCIASIDAHGINGESDPSSPLKVVVKPKPAELVAVPSAGTFENGTTVVLTCTTATISADLTYKIYQDTTPVAGNNTLTISAVKDSGTYTCEAILDSVVSDKSKAIKVRFVVKPTKPTLTMVPSQPTDGEKIVLNCKTTADADITCFEFKHYTINISTCTGKNIKRQSTSTFIGQHTINKATISVHNGDNGDYSCIASIDTVKSEKSDTLEVLLKPKTPTLINTVPAGYWVSNGTREVFTCHTESLGPDMEYRIFRDQTEVHKGENGSHVIQSADTNDTGDYTCQAKIDNSTWSKPSKKCSMTVINEPRQPELTVQPSGPNFQHGDQLNFTCTSLTHGYNLSHLFFNCSNSIANRKSIWYSVNTSLENIDTYEYTCKVAIKGVESKYSNPIIFAVMPRTPTLTVSPTESTIESGTKLKLTCTPQSIGDLDYIYLQDDQPVFQGRDDSHTIDTSTSHSGKYSCKVSINNVDSLKSNIHFKDVVDKPVTQLITDVNSPTFGDEILLKCDASSNRITRVEFKRNQDILPSDKSNILQIDLDAIGREEATYFCIGHIDTVSSEPSPGVNISYLPPGLSVDPPDQICRCLDQATLSCDATSKTVKNYMFFRDGTEVYSGSDKSHLVLTKNNKAGVYSCKVQVKGQISSASMTYKLIDCASARTPCGSGEHTCKENELGYTCDCQIGYKLNNKSTPVCDDIDECQSPDKICELAGIDHTCENTIGSYRCVCRDGYENVDVKRTACDKTIQEPGKPVVDVFNFESIGVMGAVAALSSYIIIFVVTVIVLDIRLLLIVLYRLCTTVAVVCDDSDSEEDSEEDSGEDLPANQDDAGDKVPGDPINDPAMVADSPLTNTVHNPSTHDFLNTATKPRNSSWASEDMTMIYQGENANVWRARGSLVWTQRQELPSRAESEDQISNTSIIINKNFWSSNESLSENSRSDSSQSNKSMRSEDSGP